MISKVGFGELGYKQKRQLLENIFALTENSKGTISDIESLFRLWNKPSEKILVVCYNMLKSVIEIGKGQLTEAKRKKIEEQLKIIHKIEQKEKKDMEKILYDI